MLAPGFIKDRFRNGMYAMVWFRNNAQRGMPGVIKGWEEHEEELTSYVLFRTIDGDVLYLPFADIYLSTMCDDNYQAARADYELAQKAKEINRKQLAAQIEAAEQGGGRIQPVQGPGGFPRIM